MAKSGITMVTADGKDFLKDFKNLNEGMILGIANGISAAMAKAALFATQRYMIMTRGIAGAKLRPVHPTKLTWRSGDLARSWLNKFTFEHRRLSKVKGIAFRRPKSGGGEKQGYRTIKIEKGGVTGEQGTDVPYAPQHEFGIEYPKRPSVEPAAKDIQREFKGICEVELNKVSKTLGYA